MPLIGISCVVEVDFEAKKFQIVKIVIHRETSGYIFYPLFHKEQLVLWFYIPNQQFKDQTFVEIIAVKRRLTNLK